MKIILMCYARNQSLKLKDEKEGDRGLV